MSSIRVQLQQFEGPLDLLLYLIRKEEMDIFNINIVEITKQYLDFIKLMKEFDLEVAGDFIAMASTLIQIKSKMLLPSYDENGEAVENIDPRKELVQKLLEYEKYKEASKALYDRPLLNRDVWARGLREKLEVANDDIELEDNALFALISSYRKMVKTLHKKIHKVNIKLQSVASRILEMREKLIPGHTIRMVELFRADLAERIERSRHALITFLSLLELGKMGYVGIYQTENYGDIHVQTKKEIEGDVVSKVEEYGNMDADTVAQSLFAKSSVLTEQELEILDQEDDVLASGTVQQMSFEENMAAIAADVASDDDLLAAEIELEADESNSAPFELGAAEDTSTEVLAEDLLADDVATETSVEELEITEPAIEQQTDQLAMAESEVTSEEIIEPAQEDILVAEEESTEPTVASFELEALQAQDQLITNDLPQEFIESEMIHSDDVAAEILAEKVSEPTEQVENIQAEPSSEVAASHPDLEEQV
ncbi:MAG: segregation/condensation protein A [Bdellovibrio sp.]|nr:segregation/condensation protein A [Bdellovibrio sp.]